LDGERFLMYSHDGLGFGHARRNLAIATALTSASPNASVLLATSADEIHRLGVPPRVDVVKLPGLRKVANEQYTGRRLRIGGTGVINVRNSLLQATVESFKPSVILVDKHPLGARGELVPAIATIRGAGGRTVLGFRDILDEPQQVRAEWRGGDIPAVIAEHYDRILVYGHPAVLDPATEYGLPPEVAARTRFTGYVCNPPPVDRMTRDAFPLALLKPDGRPTVLATAGGGEDGFAILEAFIEAAAGADWRAIVVAGSQSTPEKRQQLREAAERAGVTFHTFVRGLDAWFDAVDCLVCMGGYNTIAEALSRGTPTVCVPRIIPRTEQLIRAEAFSRLGLMHYVHPERLTGESLREEVRASLQDSRTDLRARAHARLGFDGAQRAATLLLELAAPGEKQPAAVSMR
jgi:predicted glycosyltransferase